MDPDGLALMLIFALLGLGFLAVAWLVESGPCRRWIRRLEELERARVTWEARMVADQHFWRENK